MGCPAWPKERSMVKPNLRIKSIGTKVSEDEYAQLERAAQKSAKTLGEWCRELMLANANGQPANPNGTGPEAYAIMAELRALRAIRLTVLSKQAKGEPLTAEEMQQLIDRADSDKGRKARERLDQASASKAS